MNKNTFTINNDKNQLHATREFNGPLELEWKVCTDAELLDEWWVPKPWKTETKSMEFREGGRWLCCLKDFPLRMHFVMKKIISIPKCP